MVLNKTLQVDTANMGEQVIFLGQLNWAKPSIWRQIVASQTSIHAALI